MLKQIKTLFFIMLALKGRQDRFLVTLPKEIIPKDVEKKYAEMLTEKRSFITKPIDLLNETIQRVEVLGVTNASVIQRQQGRAIETFSNKTMVHSNSDVAYRSPDNPLSLIDKTINITFRHILGYINYFLLFESFLKTYERETKYKDMAKYITVDLLGTNGSVYARLMLLDPIIDGIDMLSLDNTQPVAQSQSFNVSIKYSNFDYQFIKPDLANWNGEVE